MRQRRHWIVVETEAKAEATARRSILALGIECPFLCYRGRPHRGVRPILHIFEGYLLTRVDANRNLADLRGQKGVRRPLGRVRDVEAEYVLSMVGDDGYIHLEDCEPPAFALRESVQALSGAFRGHIGEFRGYDAVNPKRAIVVFELMRREVASSILRYDLRSSGSAGNWLDAA